MEIVTVIHVLKLGDLDAQSSTFHLEVSGTKQLNLSALPALLCLQSGYYRLDIAITTAEAKREITVFYVTEEPISSIALDITKELERPGGIKRLVVPLAARVKTIGMKLILTRAESVDALCSSLSEVNGYCLRLFPTYINQTKN